MEIFATFDLPDDEDRTSFCQGTKRRVSKHMLSAKIIALHVLAEKRDIGELNQRMFRDRFVVEPLNEELSDSLRMDTKLTL